MASCYYMYFFELKKIYHEKYLIVFPNAAILSYNWVDFYVFTLFFLRKRNSVIQIVFLSISKI